MKPADRRARARARKEMRAMAADYDAELAVLSDRFHELATAHHQQCLAAAIDEAVLERNVHPGMLLN